MAFPSATKFLFSDSFRTFAKEVCKSNIEHTKTNHGKEKSSHVRKGKVRRTGRHERALGGKGANLAEMNLIGVPVPPGFTITTDVCSEYYELGKEKVVELLESDVKNAIKNIEALMNSKFGDVENPLLVSVRSGARASMPGMMDTILNLGLNDEVVEGLARKTNNPRFAWDHTAASSKCTATWF